MSEKVGEKGQGGEGMREYDYERGHNRIDEEFYVMITVMCVFDMFLRERCEVARCESGCVLHVPGRDGM
jgi:hypothetical protein